MDEKGPLPDLDLITFGNRDVVILFDANAATNNKVQAARRAFAAELAKSGAKVRIGELPAKDNILVQTITSGHTAMMHCS